jgi:hypothetical protein
MMKRLIATIALAACIPLATACSDDDGSADDGGIDAGSDAGEDSGAGTDTGTGTGTGTDTGSDTEWPGAPWYGCTADDEPAGSTVVTAFELADQYLGAEDRRQIDALVEFPESGQWERIDMRIELGCPADGDCDNWDRFANVMLVEEGAADPDAGADGGLDAGATEELVELERYITPFNVGMCMLTDVTAFAPRLEGSRTLRSFIDTWVGPDGVGNGHGWRVTVKFIFHPGTPPDGLPAQMLNVIPYASIEVGNPADPIGAQTGETIVAVPAGVTKAELRAIVTGHGQGNADNCAEFCRLSQVVMVNGTAFTFDPWRADCGQNPIGPLQAGSWQFPRSGWCPGAYVLPQVFDVTGAIVKGASNTLEYQVRDASLGTYENTCRPGAGDTDNVCAGCVFTPDTPGNCDYNGGDHTQPIDRVSLQLVLYE